jgi:hypothetical protein
MKTTSSSLPGIKSIGFINADNLIPRVDLRAICKMQIPVLTAITPIEFCGEASCKFSSEVKDNSRYETAELSFSALAELPLNLNLGYIVTDNNDNNWLIGSREHPRAITKSSRPTGDDDEPAIFNYEISLCGIKAKIPCLIPTLL